MSKIKTWQALLALIIAFSTVVGISAGGAEKAYIHFTGVDTLRAEMMASRQLTEKEIELLKIQYSRGKIDDRIWTLERRQEAIWARHPMTRKDNLNIKKIVRELRKLENRRDKLNEREQELSK